MMKTISPKYDKFPRNFLTTHRIACRNYNRLKKSFQKKYLEVVLTKIMNVHLENIYLDIHQVHRILKTKLFLKTIA